MAYTCEVLAEGLLKLLKFELLLLLFVMKLENSDKKFHCKVFTALFRPRIGISSSVDAHK